MSSLSANTGVGLSSNSVVSPLVSGVPVVSLDVSYFSVGQESSNIVAADEFLKLMPRFIFAAVPVAPNPVDECVV